MYTKLSKNHKIRCKDGRRLARSPRAKRFAGGARQDETVGDDKRAATFIPMPMTIESLQNNIL